MDDITKKRLMNETEALHERNDWSAAEALWRPYVEQDDLEAQFHLAHYYLFYSFDGEPETRSEMEKLLRTAAERGHPDAVYWLSHLCPHCTERDALLLKAGALGSREGQRDLGAAYATGQWTGPCDLARAAEWYRRAAERGHADAQYNLGFMYLLGEGVTKDRDEGLRWLRLAGDQGDESALLLLGDLYEGGYFGVPIDAAEAAQWAERYRISQQRRAAKQPDTVDPPA